MKDQYMTLVIKPAGLVEFPRSISINGVPYTVELVANGHVPAAHDVAEQFVKDYETTLQAREEEDEDEVLVATKLWVDETLQQMHNQKEHGYGE